MKKKLVFPTSSCIVFFPVPHLQFKEEDKTPELELFLGTFSKIQEKFRDSPIRKQEGAGVYFPW